MQGTDATTALQFTESSNYTAAEIFHSLPNTRLVDMPVMDTASGQGVCWLALRRHTHYEPTSQNETPGRRLVPIYLFPGVGIAGPLGFAQVNSDVYFRADGLRLVRLAAGELQTPGSGGLQQEIPERFQGWRQYAASSVHFNAVF